MTFKVDTLREIVLKAAENGFDDFDIQGMLADFREEHGINPRNYEEMLSEYQRSLTGASE